MKLELKKFDPSKIAQDSVIAFIGKRNTGKSVAMKSILAHHKNIPIGTVISPTEKANGFFEHFIPRLLIHDEPDIKIVRNFVDRQMKITEERKKEIKKTGNSNIDNRAFLILDDCLYDKKWINDTSIRCVFLNGRHLKIFYLISLQFSLGLPPILRNNIDYVFIFRNNIMREKQKIYDNYAGMFPSFEAFCQVMNQTTENYECMVIDNKVQSNKLEDQVFWYKAKQTDFKMCSNDLWELQRLEDQRQDLDLINEEESDEEPFDSGVFIKKRDTNIINVKKKSGRY